MTLRHTVVAILACFVLVRPADAQRLPTTVTPEHYDLTFAIDLAGERFTGVTAIDVRVAQPTKEIRLHALDMDFTSASVRFGGQTHRATATFNTNDQTATLTLPDPVPAGEARIDIAYRAKLNDQLRGLYVSKTSKRSYAVTQLEATDARRAFPCFDEPTFKATFALTVVADRGDTAISNGRMISDSPGPAATQHTMKFSTTAKMSAYLVALAVGDFQCLEGASDGIPIRICATPDKKPLGRIALESAERILAFLNRYHTIKYPYGKLDVVAVPDFAAGAMENTAAIFYRETDLLADGKTASMATRRTIASILSHEMAHQWFGDLVTMQWWDDLWLNESFATWMAPKPPAESKPEWHMELTEQLETQTALNLDSLSSTHPIHVNVNTPDEIESVFDPISYEKGASVLRMVESYLGPETFRKGVNAYLEKHQYANATSEDFFGALTSASGKPVDRVMATFVMQPGVPQLDVSLKCDNGKMQATLSQRRFTIEQRQADSRVERWQIPVCLKTPASGNPTCTLMTEPTQTIDVATTCTPWVFANAGGKGYFRTAYTPALIKALARDAESALSAPERLSLISDEWALVRASRHTVADYLDLASGFGREPMADVLGSVTERLDFVDESLTTPANRQVFRAFVRSLLAPGYQSVGFARRADDSEDVRSLRNVLLGALGLVAQDPDVIAKARRAVTDAVQARSADAALDPIVAGTLVRIAAAHGDGALFDALMRAGTTATDPQERYRYLYALPAFTDPALIQRALEYALSPELKSQDTALYLSGFFANEAARDRAWTFVKQRWTDIEPKIKISGGDSYLVNSLASFCSARARDDIRGFFTTHKLPAAERALRLTLERIDNCIATKERQQPALESWLAKRQSAR